MLLDTIARGTLRALGVLQSCKSVPIIRYSEAAGKGDGVQRLVVLITLCPCLTGYQNRKDC